MFPKDEFKKYATQHLGMSTMHLEKYMAASVPNITGFTPQVIEERQMNIVGMDVFSRLMMDRIIFMGVPVNDYVANVIQAQLLFLESTDPKRLHRWVLYYWWQAKRENELPFSTAES